MTFEEFKKDFKIVFTINYLIYVGTAILIIVGSEFFKTKGQNLATKQDIGEITKEVEQIKSTINISQEIDKQKRELKVKSLLNSLTIIDAFISQKYNANGSIIDKQNSSTEEVRSCHNNLILTCEDTSIINLFTKILLPPRDSIIHQDPILLLNQYRNLIRKELGFGIELKLDSIHSWFGHTLFKK